VNGCKPLEPGGTGDVPDDDDDDEDDDDYFGGRGLHSFTFQLNVSAFCGIGGALTVCLGFILRVFRRCRWLLGGVGGLKGVCRVRYGSG
jgi:hypothetical protein